MDVKACLAVFLGAVLLAAASVSSGKDRRTLLISVFQTDDLELARELLANTPAVESDESGYHTTVRTYGTDSARSPGNIQQVRVVEGQEARFSSGYSSPEARFLWAEETRRGLLPNVDLVKREAMSGFTVKAELQGKQVLLELDRYSSQPQHQYTDYDLQQNIHTTIYGQVGGWLDAGGSLPLEREPSANRVYSLQHDNDEQTRFLIKVELVR